MLKYKFQKTETITQLLIKIEALKIVFSQVKTLPQFEENLRRESLLKSALFSARVEGNPLSLEKVKQAGSLKETADLKKREVFNLLTAYKYVYGPKSPQKLSLKLIKKIHQLVMKGISPEAGCWLAKSGSVFNQAGVAIYLAPAPFRLPELMEEFVRLTDELKNEVPVKAALLQFLFEKIHPCGMSGRPAAGKGN